MSDEESGREEQDARLARAAMKALSARAPAELTAALKRRARSLEDGPSPWEALRRALSGGSWAYGAGAAFAAASVVAAVWSALPPEGSAPPAELAGRTPPPGAPAFRSEPAAPATLQARRAPTEIELDLAALWTDDDGEDHDEG